MVDEAVGELAQAAAAIPEAVTGEVGVAADETVSPPAQATTAEAVIAHDAANDAEDAAAQAESAASEAEVAVSEATTAANAATTAATEASDAATAAIEASELAVEAVEELQAQTTESAAPMVQEIPLGVIEHGSIDNASGSASTTTTDTTTTGSETTGASEGITQQTKANVSRKGSRFRSHRR